MMIDTRFLVQNSGSSVYVCSLVVGHSGNHEAWESHKVGPVGGCLSAWPQETESPEVMSAPMPTYEEIVRRLENLEQTSATGAATDDMFAGLGSRLDAFEDRLQRLRDDTRDAAAAAGEALERTKGLQVSEILRRLKNQDSRIHDLERNEPGQVLLETATDDRLLNAVTELTTVMRELVRQNTPPEVCGAPDQIGHVTCELEKGHTSRHVNGISSWPQVPCGVSRLADGDKYPCERPAGHGGLHRDRAGCSWPQKADPEPRTCPATMSWHDVPVGPRTHRCTRSAGHTGPHRDQDGDDWEVTGV